MIIIAAAGGILAYVESRSKRNQQNADASESFMTAADMAGRELVAYKKKTDATISEMLKQIAILQHKKYSVYVEFEIGDPPIPGKVEVRPIIPRGDIARAGSKK